jgi:hypothetical protein
MTLRSIGIWSVVPVLRSGSILKFNVQWMRLPARLSVGRVVRLALGGFF